MGGNWKILPYTSKDTYRLSSTVINDRIIMQSGGIVHMNLTKELAVGIMLTSNGKLNSFCATGNYYKIIKKENEKGGKILYYTKKDGSHLHRFEHKMMLPHTSFSVLRQL